VKYRRWILLAGLTSATLVACPQPPAPPAPVIVNCNNSPTFEPASSVTVTGVTTDASTRVVDAADISSVETNRLQVAETGGAFKAGELVVSECNEGLIRKISGIQAASSNQLSPLGIKKVYIQTEDATLEDVISAGTADIGFGDVDLDKAVTTQSLPGIRTQAVNGKIAFANVKVPLPTGATVTLNGFVQQTLDPKFNLVFSKNSLEKFEVSLKGSFAAELKGTLETGGKFTLQAGTEQSVASYRITRAFLVGAIPVVIVLEPKLIVGAKIGANDTVKVTAGITPTLNLNLGFSYDRTRAAKWQVVSGAPLTLNANPSFAVSIPNQGKGAVYAKLQLGIKLYGVAGPVLEFKPYVDTDINPDKTAAFRTGVSSSATLTAGFKVLGKGLELAADLPQPAPAAMNYLCKTTGCAAQ
jgi:hypothetical protein